MRYPDFPFVDFAISDVRARNHVVELREALEARSAAASQNSFVTVYRFPAAYREHCAAAGTVRGYEGPCYADFLPIDVDRAGNLQAALQAARGLAHTLHERYDVRPDQLRYYFSGAKGFHLLIPVALFGDVRPSEHLPAIFRALALQIAEDAGEEIDRVIYDQNRLFRLPDTRHPSGLWKVELSWEELSTWTTDQVRFAARQVRDYRGRPHDLEPLDALVELFARVADAVESPTRRSPRAQPSGLAGAIACAVEPFFTEGKRHALVLALAGYAAKRHLPRETMLGVVDELLEGEPNVVDPENLPTAVNDTYDRVRQGDPVKGYTDLVHLMAEADLAALRALLGDTRPKELLEREAAPAVRVESEEGPEFDAMLGDVLERMAAEKMAPIEATPTPWSAWNRVCRGAGGTVGIARGWHVVIGARSGNGKSLLGANLAAAAIRTGERAAIVSLEMSQTEMQTRVMAIAGSQRINDLEHGQYFQLAGWKAATRAMQEIYDRTGGVLFINRRPLNRLSHIASAIRSLHEREGVRYFVVDYLQLAAIGGGSMSQMLDRITEVSMVVRGLAKDLGVTTIGMSQLNRETSKAPETPRKEGLMGGSPLENDAEQVLLLDHSRIERVLHGIRSWAVLDKNRHGEVVEIPTFLNTATLELRERLPDEISLKESA